VYTYKLYPFQPDCTLVSKRYRRPPINRTANILIGAFTCAYGRIHLARKLLECGRTPLYTDTVSELALRYGPSKIITLFCTQDSIIVLDEGAAPFTDELPMFGRFVEEHATRRICEFVSLGMSYTRSQPPACATNFQLISGAKNYILVAEDGWTQCRAKGIQAEGAEGITLDLMCKLLYEQSEVRLPHPGLARRFGEIYQRPTDSSKRLRLNFTRRRRLYTPDGYNLAPSEPYTA
jgi:hypothetical protein